MSSFRLLVCRRRWVADLFLICHDVLHDEIFILFLDSLIQFLFILANQVLYVDVVLGVSVAHSESQFRLGRHSILRLLLL